MMTLCYREVFDYPLTRQELHRYLLLAPADNQMLDQVLESLEGTALTRQGDYILPGGRDDLPALRERRREKSRAAWKWAFKYASYLRWVPFVRMVGISGSVAVDNADDGADIDIFFISSPRRMWLARFLMAPLWRISVRNLPYRACLNCSLSESEMLVPDQNVYIAHQIALMVPIWGGETYRGFMEANSWIRGFFPQLDMHGQQAVREKPAPLPTRLTEWMLSGALGDWLNGRLHRLATRRAMKRDHQSTRVVTPDILRRTHSLESFRFVRTHVYEVRDAFTTRYRERMGPQADEGDIARLFATMPDSPAGPAVVHREGASAPNEYYQTVGQYYDAEAADFSRRYFSNHTLQRIRASFRRTTARYPFSTALEIGSGPGLDLEFWGRARPDASIDGIDVSSGMVGEARARIQAAGLTNVRCAVGSVEDIRSCYEGRHYDLVYVYFGALNTVADLRQAARDIRAVMNENGVAVLTFVNRWFMEEMIRYFVTFRWERAFARWRTVWGGYAPNRPLASRCYSPRQVREAFGEAFRITRTEGFSILHPSWPRDKWVKRFPRLCNFLWRVDRLLCHTPLWCWGEYALYVLEPRKGVLDRGGRVAESKRAPVEKSLVDGTQPDRTSERLDERGV